MKISNLKIGARLGAGFGIVLAALAGTGWMAVDGLAKSNAVLEQTVNVDAVKLEAVLEVQNWVRAQSRRIIELADRRALFSSPQHPYTEALLSAVPVPDPGARRQRVILQGEVPSPINRPTGCHFHTRCPYAEARCKAETPPMREVRPGHFAACHLRPGKIVAA